MLIFNIQSGGTIDHQQWTIQHWLAESSWKSEYDCYSAQNYEAMESLPLLRIVCEWIRKILIIWNAKAQILIQQEIVVHSNEQHDKPSAHRI